jgi:hypothetical protein
MQGEARENYIQLSPIIEDERTFNPRPRVDFSQMVIVIYTVFKQLYRPDNIGRL